MSSMYFISRDKQKKLRTLRLEKAELFKDVECLSYKLAETAVADEAARDAIAADQGNGLDERLIRSFMATRDAALKQMIAFALSDEAGESPDEMYFAYDLALPLDFKDSHLSIVLQLFRDYLIRGTLLDWYTKCGSGYAATVIDDVVDLQHRVVDILRKPSFVHHPSIAYIPFGRR